MSITESVATAADDMDRDEWRDWIDSLSIASRSSMRDELVVSGLRAGYTLQEMGDEFGFSRERARQIAAERGVRVRELRALQREQQERRQRRIARHVWAYSLTYPELSIDELAELTETDTATVRSALQHRRTLHEPRGRASSPARTSEQDLLAALAEWGSQTMSLTGDDYTAWAAERGLPGKQTIAIRFGSWNEALGLAGLGESIRDRGGVRPVVSEAELWACVLEFLRADLPSYSFQGYDTYAQSRGLASGPTIRNRLGVWSGIREQARLLLRYTADPDGSWELGEAVLSMVPGEGPRNQLTRDQAVGSLRQIATQIAGPVTVAAYEQARPADAPSAALVQSRCGSWIEALLEAGLSDRLSAKARGKLERGEVVSSSDDRSTEFDDCAVSP